MFSYFFKDAPLTKMPFLPIVSSLALKHNPFSQTEIWSRRNPSEVLNTWSSLRVEYNLGIESLKSELEIAIASQTLDDCLCTSSLLF